MPPAAPYLAPPYPRLALVLCLAAIHGETCAEALPLKTSSDLSRATPQGRVLSGPSHIEANRLEGVNNVYFEAEGQVVVRNLRERVEADWLRYDQKTDEARARGHVVFRQERDQLRGSELQLRLTERLGEMKDVDFSVRGRNGQTLRGGAKLLKFDGPDRYAMEQASYTTCPAEQPDWMLKMDSLTMDYPNNLGSARQVRVEYLGTPILYTPWLDFGLDDRRKSGFLSPTYGVTTERGVELVAPWYWNIAPQRDATFYPRLMTQRGLQLGGEFRYLEAAYDGDLNLEILPGDQVADRDRYRGVLRHRQRFSPKWSGQIDFERVSDDAYFADLSNQVNQTSLVNLSHAASLAYDGGWWRVQGRAQGYQTLQDPAAPVKEPYRRLPQISASGERRLGRLAQLDFSGEFTHFSHTDASFTEGERLHFNPAFSLPITTTYSVFTPRLGWYLTRYQLDHPAPGEQSQTRSMPVFSLDAGLVLEGEHSWLGRGFIQTLEPRAYYVNIPYRDQSGIPVFDSVASDLSLDQLFSENQFSGFDRINDANQLTLAFTTRFLEQSSGLERLQATLGQRFYFSDQQVALPGTAARSSNSSDLIGQVSGQINDRLRVVGGLQFNADRGETALANLGAAWSSGPGRLFNADYRYTRNSLDQVDLSIQWPLQPKWHGLGRLNYSFRDSRMVEGLAGFEYNAGCWSLRGVLQRLATSETSTTNAFFLQLELHGLAKLGPNPLDVLKRSISGYVPSSKHAPLEDATAP